MHPPSTSPRLQHSTKLRRDPRTPRGLDEQRHTAARHQPDPDAETDSVNEPVVIFTYRVLPAW